MAFLELLDRHRYELELVKGSSERRSMRHLQIVLILIVSFLPGAIRARASERDIVLAAKSSRPVDPWPRGEGHVVYALPGSVEERKGYEEPGGSFSPAVGSFGISIWVLDAGGSVLRTSDSIPMDKIHQHYVWGNQALPAISVDTPYYNAVWQILPTGSYTLLLTPVAGNPLAVTIRSVGPAGGPVTELAWTKPRLSINSSWVVEVPSTSSLKALGHEGDTEWTKRTSPQQHWADGDGWGYAVFTVRKQSIFRIASHIPPTGALALGTQARSSIHADLPDKRFMESLNAQVTNLLMGLVEDEVRPGEPTNYPLPWLRDGAYVVVALARSGQLEQAKRLALYFSRNDFFGGFGPEADAPGLSLWAVTTVSELAKDPAFDQAVWPDVKRKADLIVTMRHTLEPIYRDPVGPIVPEHVNEPDLRLVCEPARNGLIVGRMDWGRPLLFINAVSFRGLEGAAQLADRLHKANDASLWRSNGYELQQAWQSILDTPEHDNERTYISTLWPTWVGGEVKPQFADLLNAEWRHTHNDRGDALQRPLWTYFDVAKAHQWLFLDREDRTWQTLGWFLNNQSAPDLYTWWEGDGEENNFGRWQNVRGWVAPKNVTPHYWTAAEMLLLQMDMLAYADLSTATPVIVVGAGIPPQWLKSQIHVASVSTEFGMVDWNWNHGRLSVVVSGSRAKVRAASTFGEGVPLTVSYK